MAKKNYLLPALLGIAASFPGQHPNHKKLETPKEKPHTAEMKRFKKVKSRRKLAQISRKKNRR